VLEDRCDVGQQFAIIGADHRNQAQRVDRPIVGAVSGAFGFRVDLDKTCLSTSLIERNAGGHRTGEWGEIQIHVPSPLIFVPFRIITLSSFLVSRDFLRNGTKTITAIGTEAARAAARLRSRDRAAARHRKLLARRLRRDLARRSERSDRHESAEPLWRVRRQARTLPRRAQALLGTQPRRYGRSARLRSGAA